MVVIDQNGERTLPTQSREAPSTTLAAAVGPQQTLAWVERASHPEQDDYWDLFGRDASGTMRRIASSVRQGGKVLSAPNLIAVDGTRAYLTVRTGQESEHPSILAVPLQGGPVTTLVADASMPAIGWQGVHFVRTVGTEEVEFGVVSDAGLGEPRIIHTETLAGGETVTGQCPLGDNLVWAIGAAEGKPGRISVRRPDGTVSSFTLQGRGQNPQLGCGDGLIVYTDEQPSGGRELFVAAPATGTKWRLGPALEGGSGPVIGGKTITWLTPPVGDLDSRYQIVRWQH